MKISKFLLLLCLCLFGALAARSQCCCSHIRFSLTDKKGKPLNQSELKIRETTPGSDKYMRLHFEQIAGLENRLLFDLGCGTGLESISAVYRGKEMKIYFRFRGEFGFPIGNIPFKKGTFIALPEDENVRMSNRLKSRKATKEDLQLIEEALRY